MWLSQVSWAQHHPLEVLACLYLSTVLLITAVVLLWLEVRGRFHLRVPQSTEGPDRWKCPSCGRWMPEESFATATAWCSDCEQAKVAGTVGTSRAGRLEQ